MKSQNRKKYFLKTSNQFGWGIDCQLPQYKIQELLPLIEGKKILDIGCGSGEFVDILSKKKFISTGIDITPEFIKHAQKKFQGNFLIADASKLPFKNKEFDTVFIRNVLEHIKNDKQALKEAVRVGKKIIIIVPQKTPDILKNRGLIFSHYQDKSHLRNYTPITLKKLILNSNGKLIKIIPLEKLPNKSIFFELFQAPKIIKKIITKIFFIFFKEQNFYLELLAIIK